MLDPVRLRAQFQAVESLRDLTFQAIDVVRRTVNVCLVNASLFPMTQADLLHVDIWCDEFPPELVARNARAALPRIDVELGTAAELSARNRECIDVEPMFASQGIDITRTSTYADFWRPTKVERQALAYLGPPGTPCGFLCAVRKTRGHAFSPEELTNIGMVREAMEGAVAQLVPPPLEEAADLLGILSRELPVIATAFDCWGRVLWMTCAAAAHFGIDRALESSAHERYCNSARLEAWRTLALAAIKNPPGQAERVDGRRIVARVVDTPRGSIVLLRVDDGLGTGGDSFPLSRREREICELIAQGYDTINAAAVLGISVHTARLHLKNVYRKLGVANRASLVLRIAAGKWNAPRSGPHGFSES